VIRDIISMSFSSVVVVGVVISAMVLAVLAFALLGVIYICEMILDRME
jgi:hypothetical protein